MPTSASDDPYDIFLRKRAAKTFYLLPYGGNAGDSLIRLATFNLLGDLGIRTTVDPGTADVILVPGGNPSLWPSSGARRWQAFWERYPNTEFVVGPAGFRSDRSEWALAINAQGQRVTGVFARDPESFESLQSAALRPDIAIALSRDPALYLRDSDWMRAHRAAVSEEYDLVVFRNDHEADFPFCDLVLRLRPLLGNRVHVASVRRLAAAGRRRRVARLQRSADPRVPLLTLDASRQSLELFVETVRAARFVHTDRLHVMLLAAMLGKRVFAYPTSHGKLEGVYHHSLAGWADVTMAAS